jgi:hypothetical protein
VSQGAVQHVVDIAAQTIWIKRGKACPPTLQHSEGQRSSPYRSEFCDGTTVSRDGQPLARRHSVDHFAAMVPQLSDRHLTHELRVYHA